MPTRSANVVTNQTGPEDLEQYRRELIGYCYRMLGSGFEAEDAVQETMVRAWRGIDRFEGRAALRSWLYRIATNVCLDMLRGRQRRAQAMDLGPSSIVDAAAPGPSLPEATWVLPFPEERVIADDGDPAEVVASRETIRLAFIAALQHLPARQRAVLILRDVLRWRAVEVAQLLDTSVASVNSALQRAHATLATRDLSAPPRAADGEQRDLLARYMDAFERFDVPRLVSLLHDDAVQSMPPYAMWLRGAADIGRWLLGPGMGCSGSRLVATAANGSAAFGQYRPDGSGGHRPWALQVIEVSGDRISALHNFLVSEPDSRAGGAEGPASRAGGATDLFAAFGLPAHLGR